jgi:hypothetical protein
MTTDNLAALIADGDIDGLRAALDAGADPNVPVETGYSLLYLARDVRMMALLLERGADPDWQTEQSETALTFAAHDGARDAVEILLAGGANPSLPTTDWPPLFYATMSGHLDVVKILADAGADLLRTQNDRTALIVAIDHHRWDIAALLLERSPGIASRGSVDPAGMAFDEGERALADRIAELRWSEPDQGLRGRLRASLPGSAGGSYRIVLELENVGTERRSVPIEDPMGFSWELTCDGVPVRPTCGRAEIMHGLGWYDVAPRARVQIEASAEPTRVGSAYRLDLLTDIWPQLPAGKLHLGGTYQLDPRQAAGAPSGARPFTLALPSCRLPEAGWPR